jgi:hypothetical protein
MMVYLQPDSGGTPGLITAGRSGVMTPVSLGRDRHTTTRDIAHVRAVASLIGLSRLDNEVVILTLAVSHPAHRAPP